jgi:hypothetical protein
MTIRSPSRRLRLCILSLSLFCSGVAVIIECVLYADGSLWTNPQAKAGLCDNLRGYKR